MGRHIYVPKPPKKPRDSVSKGRVIARALLASFYVRRKLVPVASCRISSMAPRDPRDTNGRNGNVQSVAKSKAKVSRSSLNSNIPGLTQEDADAGIDAVRQISKILSFAKTYQEEIDDVENIYGIGIRQQARIEELERAVTDLAFRKKGELERLQEENDAYQANARQFQHAREELERDQASMDDNRRAMQLQVERQKEKEINEAKHQLSEKAKVKIKQVREELEKKIQALETEKHALNEKNERLGKKNIQAFEDLNQEKESFNIDRKSYKLHIQRLESELCQIKAASLVSPQTPQFYMGSFHRLGELIRDVAFSHLIHLPEDARSLDSETVRNGLSSASAIFKYPVLSSESAVSTFLRACAIQNYLSTKTVSVIQRRYFAEPTVAAERQCGLYPMDWILDIISSVPAATSSQELSWRLTTVDKLDHLRPNDRPITASVSTEPNEREFVQTILDKLHYFQSPNDQCLLSKLAEIASVAVELWSAVRKDSCQVDFSYDPSTSDKPEWALVDYESTNSSKAAALPGQEIIAQLPSKSFVLFPRIMGSFDGASPRILHAGSALPHDSLAFREGLQEIEHIKHATEEFERSLRRGSSAKSSPVTDRNQDDWPRLHHKSN